jgi:hypothetical protein
MREIGHLYKDDDDTVLNNVIDTEKFDDND